MFIRPNVTVCWSKWQNYYNSQKISLHKEWNFLFKFLRISSANETESIISCGFYHIYWGNPKWKNFLCSGFSSTLKPGTSENRITSLEFLYNLVI